MRRRKAPKRTNCCPNSPLKRPKPIIIQPVPVPVPDREEETETETDSTTHQPSFIVYGGNIDDFRATNSMSDGEDDDDENLNSHLHAADSKEFVWGEKCAPLDDSDSDSDSDAENQSRRNHEN
jgi:hypothetical protein